MEVWHITKQTLFMCLKCVFEVSVFFRLFGLLLVRVFIYLVVDYIFCVLGGINTFLYFWFVLYYTFFIFNAIIGFGVVFCIYEDILKIDFYICSKNVPEV